MTEKAESTFEGLLSKYAAFRSLDPDRLRQLAQRARPFHCTVGQNCCDQTACLSIASASWRVAVACFMMIWSASTGALAYATPGIWLVGLV